MPGPVREDVPDKRQAILRAARDLFADQGYEDTTIAEIARVAGVAVGTVYLYFTNKRDIQLDVCLALDAEIAQVIQSEAILSLPIRQVPRAIIEASFRKSRENMRFMWSYQLDPATPAEARRLDAVSQQIADALDTYFQQVIARGDAQPFATRAYATLLNQLVGAALKQCFTLEQGEHEEFYREGLIDLIERLFFGPPLAGS